MNWDNSYKKYISGESHCRSIFPDIFSYALEGSFPIKFMDRNPGWIKNIFLFPSSESLTFVQTYKLVYSKYITTYYHTLGNKSL